MAALTSGLSSTDLGLIRDTLAAGRKPKVVFTEAAGQIAGKIGQVIELTDAKASDEWIVVRFGRDVLPFSPADLAIPAKSTTTTTARPSKSVPAKPTEPEPPLRLTEPPNIPAPRERSPALTNGTARPAAANSTASSAANSTASSAANGTASTATARHGKAAKGKAPASLTVTLAYTDREWTVTATQGAKTLARPYVIKPTEALQMVALIDVPGVHEAVENIIAAERAEAEGRALRLREELAEIESRLAELTGRE
jgi:hypothetical protein